MRQTGILAAAGIYALEHNIEWLAEDHANAKRLARGLKEIPGIKLAAEPVETNMVYADISATGATSEQFAIEMAERGIRILVTPGKPVIRFVTHLDISRGDVDTFLDHARAVLA